MDSQSCRIPAQKRLAAAGELPQLSGLSHCYGFCCDSFNYRSISQSASFP